jgi:hypothetical protein
MLQDWEDLVFVAILNLVLAKPHRAYEASFQNFRGSSLRSWQFTVDEICRLVDERWESLCWNRERAAQWNNHVKKALKEGSFTEIKRGHQSVR